MSEFDLKLIHEFKLVPAFYNRKCGRFKDKAFVDKAWNNIGKKLKMSHNVEVLKDRMYQLRNRYNVEKRKMQALRNEGIINPKPMWPLFHNLNFLNSHIRQRKSYKMMRSKKCHQNFFRNGFRGFTKEEGQRYIIHRNVEIEIKREPSEVKEIEYESRDDMDDTDDRVESSELEPNNLSRTSQTLKNINILKQSLLDDDCSGGLGIVPRNHHSSHKYEAFGEFVSASLQDLPQDKALVMIDRFTGDIVQALIANHADSANS